METKTNKMSSKLNPNLKRLWKLPRTNKLLTNFYVWDTETGIRNKKDTNKIEWILNGRPESFIFGCIVGHNFRKEIHSLSEMINEFKNPRYKKAKIFAHNAEYDLTTVYGCIFDLDPEAIFNGKFICCTNGNCVFADSLNIFTHTSVKDIGRMMNMEKLGMADGNYSYSDWNNPQDKKRDIDGCFRDCDIIYEALLRVFEFTGSIKITQASLCMDYYRRFHQPYHIDSNQHTKHFWQSYFGGRCEAFKMGKTHSHVIDVNSMYPYMMKKTVFPNPKNLKVELDIPIKKIKMYLEHYEGCIYADVFHKPFWIGFLPIKKDGKLLFPIGNISGCWNFNEFRFALKYGVIEVKKIHKIVYSDKMPSPFVSFVDKLQELKLRAEIEGNEFERHRAKIFSNSLYGKFAQRIQEETIYLKDIEKQFFIIQEYQKENRFIKLVRFNTERSDAFLVVKSNLEFTTSYSIPSFASYITSAARIEILKKLLSMENNKPVYCDTDSIFYEVDTNIQSSMFLGEWKIENKIVTEILGLKNYKFVDKKKSDKEIWRIKGVPVNKNKTLKLWNGSTVPIVEQLSGNKFRYYNLMKTKESLRRNKEPGIITERIKEIKAKYDKRIILFNGETQPIHF